MHSPYRFLITFCLSLFILHANDKAFASSLQDKPLVTAKVQTVLERVTPGLQAELESKGFKLGAPIFIRIFKLPSELEVWVKKDGRYDFFKTYTICNFSGYPGPKIREGDWQSPEGFYSVTAEQMNPLSSYHLAFNIGYPNEYDTLHKRSGGNIMVHGSCSSMGCFAMTNYRMEEIYTLVHSALYNGQHEAAVHVFPFRMTDSNMEKYRFSPWISFWKNLKEGFDNFEQTRLVPNIRVVSGRYVVTDKTRLALHTSTTN